jgi:DNA-directed RNA polymerase specialized sigma24 family protein
MPEKYFFEDTEFETDTGMERLNTAMAEDRIVAKDMAECEAFVADISHKLYRHCRELLGNETNAKDAQQETRVRIYLGWNAYRGEAPRENWAMRISTNVCLDMLRRGNLRPGREVSLREGCAAVRSECFTSAVEKKVLHEQMLQALQKCLGDRNYWIFQCHLNGMTIPRIVESLPDEWTMTKDGVKSVFDRQIKRCLGEVRRKFQSR